MFIGAWEGGGGGAGEACSVNTQEITRQQDVHNVCAPSYAGVLGRRSKRLSRSRRHCSPNDSSSEIPQPSMRKKRVRFCSFREI